MLKLEVGKKYLDKDGNVWSVVDATAILYTTVYGATREDTGENDYFERDGRSYYMFTQLVSEVPATAINLPPGMAVSSPTTPQFKVGDWPWMTLRNFRTQ